VRRVRRSRDRHRFKVKNWDPKEWRKPETVAPAPAEGEAQERLQPALHPRRPTAEEFSSHTPEKLELIDGHVPGEENLALLLLTSMGLRRAAQIVGPKVWRSAAAPLRWPPLPARPRPKGKQGCRQFEDNARWAEATRPIVEAFFHARYFVEMAVRYARLDEPPQFLPSGYAVLLCLYGLR
jgi:hypothetical protein